MVFSISAMCSFFSLRLSSLPAMPSSISESSPLRVSISALIRSTFCWWKPCVCSIFSTLSSHSETLAELSVSCSLFSSNSFWNPEMLASTDFSISSEPVSSFWISSLSCLISSTCFSISFNSSIKEREPASASSMRSSALSTESLAVFCSINLRWMSAFRASNSIRMVFLFCLVSSISFWMVSTLERRSLIFFSKSSISLLRPRRLLLFLKAPPLMAPPGTKSSPSMVTIRMP